MDYKKETCYMFNKFNNLSFLRLVETCFNIIEATFSNVMETVGKQAAMFLASAIKDDTIYRQLRQSFMIARNEWINNIDTVDHDKVHNKAAYREAYKWAKENGYDHTDAYGTPYGYVNGVKVSIEKDAWTHSVQLIRMQLAAQSKEVKRLFHYMPGLGFIIKYDEWKVVGHRLKAQSMALSVLGWDPELMELEHCALFDLSDKTNVFTETEMELTTFDREGNTTDDRLGRLQAITRGILDKETGEPVKYVDGDSGLQHAHDMDMATIEDAFKCGKLGIRGRVKDIVLFDERFNKLVTLMQDASNGLVESKEKDPVTGDPIFEINPSWFSKLNIMGPQRTWMDKVVDRRSGSWHTLVNWDYVTDPTSLKLCAHRSLNDPESDLPLARVSAGSLRENDEDEGFIHKCILDKRMSRWHMDKNDSIFAVSKSMLDRSGRHRYVVIWGYKSVCPVTGKKVKKNYRTEMGLPPIKIYWDKPQVYKVGLACDWTFAIDKDISVWSPYNGGYTRNARFIGVGVQGRMYHDVLDAFGIDWKSELIKNPKEKWQAPKEEVPYDEDFMSQCEVFEQEIEEADYSVDVNCEYSSIQDMTTYYRRFARHQTINTL